MLDGKIKKTIIAIDNMNEKELYSFLDKNSSEISFIKIGLELFCKYGPEILINIEKKYPVKIFLDLKLHDIPNTVAKSIESLRGLPISFLTIHLTGGKQMIQSALQAAKLFLPQAKILGVSYLTSLDENDLEELWGIKNLQEGITRLFEIAINTKIDGLVLSANEVPLISKLESQTSHKLVKVCPGIRFLDEIEEGNIQDQKRVLDPLSAFSIGADYLVIGRSLTKSGPEKFQERIHYLNNIK